MAWYFYKNYLLDCYQQKKSINTRYSLRAYARDLEIGHSTLIGVLKNKRYFSYKLAEKISEKMRLNKNMKYLFLNSVAREKKSNGNQKIEKEFFHYLKVQPNEHNGSTLKLSNQNGKILSQWHYYAILELTLVSDFESNAQWIAKRLNINTELVYESIDHLFTLGLLKNIEGRWTKTFLHFTGPDKTTTNQYLRQRQLQILQKSSLALEKISIERRSHNAMTLAINTDKLAIAKEEIRKFLFKMCELLEVDERKEVYELQVSLFPLSAPNIDP